MTKKKFNKEERKAIIRKLRNIARERTDASWEKHRSAYKPSKEYLKAQAFIEQRNEACEMLKNIDNKVFQNWTTFESINSKNYLDQIRDKEIEHLIERYDVNETNLEVEIILMDQDRPVDDLIERLLRNCLCK